MTGQPPFTRPGSRSFGAGWLQLTAKAVEFIHKQSAQKPFFLYYAPGGTHAPHQPTPEWIEKDAEATLSAEIDKLWVSPEDGTRLGFILSRIGFQEK